MCRGRGESLRILKVHRINIHKGEQSSLLMPPLCCVLACLLHSQAFCHPAPWDNRASQSPKAPHYGVFPAGAALALARYHITSLGYYLSWVPGSRKEACGKQMLINHLYCSGPHSLSISSMPGPKQDLAQAGSTISYKDL